MKFSQKPIIPKELIYSFVLVTICFPFWGFGENITNPLVHAFSRILMMSHFEGSLVQFAFYGGYFAMALPAALFIRKYSYKAGILLGLALYAFGALLFIPSSLRMEFWPFLISYFILTCGLSFLETSANPYVLSLGSEETATRRLNLAQSFGPIGSLIGMFTSQQLILENLNPATAEERLQMDPQTLYVVTASDLGYIRFPYVILAVFILVLFLIIAFANLPLKRDSETRFLLSDTFRRLLKRKRYREGVITQFFYVGAQIMVWTFIIHYATMELNMSESIAQGYNIVAMVIFVLSRFVCTFFLKYVSPGKLLMWLGLGGIALTLGVVFLQGMLGLYCLIGISACMSLMFPTIYGIALTDVGEDTKLGAAGLIMAILGGSVMPPLMGSIVDMGQILSFSAVRVSFLLPTICFVVVSFFGHRAWKVYQ